MTDDAKAARQAERRRRLQAALRENLKRRKAQARERATASDEPSPEGASPAVADGARED